MSHLVTMLADVVVNSGGSGAGLMAGFGIIWMIVGLIVFAFWLWMLIDCLTRPMESGQKILWFLVIFFLPLIGSLLYFFMKRGGSTRLAH